MTTVEKHEAHLRRREYAASTMTHVSIEWDSPPADGDWLRGSVAVEICEGCLYTVTACIHEKNTWHDNGTVLRCDLCGADVT